jgi:hypothetical protein
VAQCRKQKSPEAAILAQALFHSTLDGRSPVSCRLVDGARKSSHWLDGHDQLPKVIQGVKFSDGLEV